MENHVIQVDYNFIKFVIYQEIRVIIITYSRLATN